jgi:hypothetical protein
MACVSGAVSLYFDFNFIAYNENDQTTKIRVWRPRRRCEHNIVMDFQEMKRGVTTDFSTILLHGVTVIFATRSRREGRCNLFEPTNDHAVKAVKCSNKIPGTQYAY